MSITLKEVYRLSLELSPEDRQRLITYLSQSPDQLNAQQIIATLELHRDELRAMGVDRIGVFGSVVRGESDPASDIDVLVRLSHASFRDFMRLKFYLEDLFTRPVDLVLEESLRDELRPTVLREVIYAEGL